MAARAGDEEPVGGLAVKKRQSGDKFAYIAPDAAALFIGWGIVYTNHSCGLSGGFLFYIVVRPVTVGKEVPEHHHDNADKLRRQRA